MLTTEDLKKRLRLEEIERKVKTKAKKSNKNKELKTNMKIWKFPQMTNLLRTNYVVNSIYEIKYQQIIVKLGNNSAPIKTQI